MFKAVISTQGMISVETCKSLMALNGREHAVDVSLVFGEVQRLI